MEKEEIGEEEEEEGFCILAGEEATKLLLAAGGRIWSQHCPRALPHTALQDLVVFSFIFYICINVVDFSTGYGRTLCTTLHDCLCFPTFLNYDVSSQQTTATFPQRIL